MHENWKKDGPGPIILFAVPPSLEELCALNVHVDISVQSTPTGSKLQPQVIKCREFIFTEPDVIGTPGFDIKDSTFSLILHNSLYKTGRLQARLSKVGLEVTKPYPVTPDLYQSCLRYTLQARIAPLWNKAGQWLIQGRDFLTRSGCANAVKVDMAVNHNELFFTLEATVVKWSPLQIDDIDIIGRAVADFHSGVIEEIKHECIASDWCHVLPSMKKGRIMSISKDIPDESPFRSYRELKRHWKNTYGYRLPESEDGMRFYQIHFGQLGNRFYPEICLRARDIQKIARIDPKPILRTFIQDLQNKLPTICGHPLKLKSKAKFAVSNLCESNEACSGSEPNLTNKAQNYRPVYRSKEEVCRMFSRNTPAGNINTVTSQKCEGSDSIITTNRSNLNQTNVASAVSSDTASALVCKSSNPVDKFVGYSTPTTCVNTGTGPNKTGQGVTVITTTAAHQHLNPIDADPQDIIGPSQPDCARKLFPQFKPRKVLQPKQALAGGESAGKKIVPVFAAKKRCSVSAGGQNRQGNAVSKPNKRRCQREDKGDTTKKKKG